MPRGRGPAEPRGPLGGSAPPQGRRRARARPTTRIVLAHADTPVPSLDELRAAMQWAFEGKEDVSPAVLDQFAQHARFVLDGNRRMNLTAIVEPREVAAKHYLDSWRVTRLLPLLGRTVLDLGTGAGFPGVPVALAEPQAKVVLLDSTRKRIDFVNECLAALGLTRASATWERAEDHLARNRYDMVLVRAVSSVRENVRLLRKVQALPQGPVDAQGALLVARGACGRARSRAPGIPAGHRLGTQAPGRDGRSRVPGLPGARAGKGTEPCP
jgi:16S rRNA (guanine(527)-N(7))-methyltransferase RsmG